MPRVDLEISVTERFVCLNLQAGNKCMVYDVVFHPDTYYLLQKNARFKKMIHDTALDAVERQFGVILDKVNVKTPKMTFKGWCFVYVLLSS